MKKTKLLQETAKIIRQKMKSLVKFQTNLNYKFNSFDTLHNQLMISNVPFNKKLPSQYTENIKNTEP